MQRLFSNLQKLRQLYMFGLLISGYATYVELRAESNANYQALCDISPKISCTAVFNSPYGKGFGLLQYVIASNSMWNLPNGILGMIYYFLQLCLGAYFQHRFAVLLSFVCCFVSNLMSLYLAYLLYFVLVDFCVVCVAIYMVNFTCLLLTKRILSCTKHFINDNNKVNEKQY